MHFVLLGLGSIVLTGGERLSQRMAEWSFYEGHNVSLPQGDRDGVGPLSLPALGTASLLPVGLGHITELGVSAQTDAHRDPGDGL